MLTKPIKTFTMKKGSYGLCHRCEHRALWNETHTHRPRCECGDALVSKHSCYCYEPVKPLVLEMDKGEKRPPFVGWMMSGRSHAVGLPVTRLRLKTDGKRMCLYYELVKTKETHDHIIVEHPASESINQ